MHGTLREENFRELADQFRIHDERGHGAVAEQMMFYARRIDDFGVEIHQRFAVRKEEWSVRVDLAADKHVLGGQVHTDTPFFFPNREALRSEEHTSDLQS